MKSRYILLLAIALVYTSIATASENIEKAPSLKRDVRLEVLSWTPRIFVYHNFLTDEECDHLIKKASPSLKRSTVVDYDTGKNVVQSGRTSQGMFFSSRHNDPILKNIEQRIAELTLIPPENGENIQVLHYDEGAEYRPHYDYFKQDTTGGKLHIARGGERVASFLMYLNTPEAGGETVFPEVGIKVVPKKGDALLFFSCKLDGDVDPLTFHGGAPVIKGEKWLATRWMRQGAFR